MSVTAPDQSDAVLDLARARQPATDPVTFVRGDAFDLAPVPGAFDAAFVGFWWSHVLRRDLLSFLSGLHRRLDVGSRDKNIDNRFVDGSNAAITRVDVEGNSYQQRTLDNGTRHEVLKNFPPAGEIAAVVEAAGGRDVDVREMQYYWISTYRTQ